MTVDNGWLKESMVYYESILFWLVIIVLKALTERNVLNSDELMDKVDLRIHILQYI